MNDVKNLILTIVRPLVEYPDAVQLKISESADFIEYNLTTHPDDIGRVIGKQGRIAKAIRTVVYSVRLKGPKKVRLNIMNQEQ